MLEPRLRMIRPGADMLMGFVKLAICKILGVQAQVVVAGHKRIGPRLGGRLFWLQ
jgi:hypothetical protein